MTNHFTFASQHAAWFHTHPVSDADRTAMAALRELTAAHKGKLRGIVRIPANVTGHSGERDRCA
ncbi:hypothetical protein AAKU55_005249 [Oxalobacteraceae bacterium GrIS 1.11]